MSVFTWNEKLKDDSFSYINYSEIAFSNILSTNQLYSNYYLEDEIISLNEYMLKYYYFL